MERKGGSGLTIWVAGRRKSMKERGNWREGKGEGEEVLEVMTLLFPLFLPIFLPPHQVTIQTGVPVAKVN